MDGRRIWGIVALVVIAGLGVSRVWRRSVGKGPVRPVLVKLEPVPTLPPQAPGPQKDWRSLVKEKGLARFEAALAKLVRPAVQLKTRKVAPAELAVGQSRIGGVPDLPAHFAWPKFRGKHLAFVAQVDLGEVARAMPDGPLPKKGHLWFFYVSDQMSWGFDPKDAGSAVVHYEADAQLARRPLPDDIPEEGRFAPVAVSLRAYEDIPDGTDERNPTYKGDDAAQDHYGEVRNAVASVTGTSHKLLGYPEPIQDEMEDECVAASNGIYMGDAKGREDPRLKELGRSKYDWRLLMQVDSDDAADMMWGDVGRLYFWIREQDLAAKRFEKAWMIFQCG